MKTKRLTVFLFIMAVLTACTYNIGLVKTTYKMLSASQISYDTAMKTAVDLYDQNRMSEEQKAKVMEIGTVYSKAHNAAVEALASYEETRSLEDQELMVSQIEIATQALSELLVLIRPYLEG